MFKGLATLLENATRAVARWSARRAAAKATANGATVAKNFNANFVEKFMYRAKEVGNFAAAGAVTVGAGILGFLGFKYVPKVLKGTQDLGQGAGEFATEIKWLMYGVLAVSGISAILVAASYLRKGR